MGTGREAVGVRAGGRRWCSASPARAAYFAPSSAASGPSPTPAPAPPTAPGAWTAGTGWGRRRRRRPGPPPTSPSPPRSSSSPPSAPADANKKTLIIDLDETLVHSSFKPVKNADFVIPVEIDGVIHQVYVLKRPFVDEFLSRIGDLFECILFTASLAKVSLTFHSPSPSPSLSPSPALAFRGLCPGQVRPTRAVSYS